MVVTCGEQQFADSNKDTLLNPLLLAEVLSPSTADYDRGRKFEQYRTIKGFREYLIVAQETRYLEQYTLQTDGRWILSEFRESGTISLESVGVELSLDEIYRKIDFTG